MVLSIGFAITVVFLVVALLSVAWSLHVCLEYRSELDMEIEENGPGGGIELENTESYQPAPDEERLPLPFFPATSV
jgi:hypothetical protein